MIQLDAKEKLSALGRLFIAFAKIVAITPGGGLVMIPVIEDYFVRKKKLLSDAELAEMVAIAQSTPGIIAANCAVYVGSKVAGFPGAVAAVLGAVTPSFLLILAIAIFFPGLDPSNKLVIAVFTGVRCAVTALIVLTAIDMTKKSAVSLPTCLVTLGTAIALIAGANPVFAVIGAALVGLLPVFPPKQKRGDQ